jgi:hypothetical protein
MMMRNVPRTLGRGFAGNREADRRHDENDPSDPGDTYQTNSNRIQGCTYWLGHIGDFGPP